MAPRSAAAFRTNRWAFVNPACPQIDDIIAAALAEDLGVAPGCMLVAGGEPDLLERDVTSVAVVPVDVRFSGRITVRSDGVVCGLPFLDRVWEMLASAAGLPELVRVFPLVAEGQDVVAGEPVAEVKGPARAVLAGERTALNILMTASGIATEARRWQAEAGEELLVVDTRKTIPGLRALSKYAVRIGGAQNHRFGLYDMVLVKDNHVRFAGGITAAVAAARSASPGVPIEVEADTIEQAVEAARAGADIVLLDNMDDLTLHAAVIAVREASALTGRAILTEASGAIRFERLVALRRTGVNRVSASAITLAPPLDFGLDEWVE